MGEAPSIAVRGLAFACSRPGSVCCFRPFLIAYNNGMIDTGIQPAVVEAIRDAARRHGVQCVVLFGSRACGQHRPKSDVDLAISGGDKVRFQLDVEEEAPTLLQFDFVDMDACASRELAGRVAREGLTLYEEVR